MPFPMPALKQVPSPNYTPTAIAHDLVIVHMMEGSYAGSVSWLCQKQANASAHLCLKADGFEVTQLVPLQHRAWAQCAFNGRGVSIECEGFTAKGFTDTTMTALARCTAWLLQAYGIPCQHARGGKGRGFCSHHDLGAAGGGHIDICGVNDATWVEFEARVKAAYADLATGPLPAWALHGAPAPHAASLPPAVPPEPSHGGVARNEPADVVAHPTASSFPHGSTMDLQWRLNKAGAKPAVTVDGSAGPATIGALEAFQTAQGLTADGVLGPLTWAALDRATS